MKICNYCAQELNYDNYHTNKATMDGYSNRCKGCTSAIRKIKRGEKKALQPKVVEEVTEYKKCKSCTKIFHLTRFNKCKITKDGREGVCRSCRVERRKANGRERQSGQVIKTEKHCSRCKETNPIGYFSKDASRDDGFSAICKVCKSETYSYYSKNPDAREAARRRTATWKKENPDKAREYYQKVKVEKIEKTKEYHNSPSGRYTTIKAQAKHRGIPFNLTREFVNNHWNSSCYYCDEELDVPRFDRLNSSMAYEEGNVVPCCKGCNYAKLEQSEEEYIKRCRMVVENFKGKF
jgi:hypothetical protein